MCHEFYYLLVGEATMYWGEDASKIRAGTANKVLLKAGDLGYWTPGWKYSVKNTGKVPGTYFWGLTIPTGGGKCRTPSESLQWLKAKNV
jgi:mannose-6-phosphate isomerase-like protein (cupin superfamily)